MHSKIERLGLLETDPFMGSALIDMYSKCGSLVDAEKVFHKLSVRDVVSWNTMILAYAKEGEGNKSLQCVVQMQSEGISPTAATFICTLKACGNIGAMEKAREIHAEIERSGLLGSDILVANTLVDTYAKCGFLSKAADAFDKLLVQGVISWTALMAGYAHAGESSRVFHIFESMLGEGIRPDPVAFVVLLNACSRAGSVEKSRSYYEAMSASYGIVPSLEHHACVMNLFSRTGRLQKAAEMVEDMGFCWNRVMLQTMLSGCRYWGNMELGKDVFQSAIELEKDDQDSGLYTHLLLC
jgi:pentatricopeptide repeat protein